MPFLISHLNNCSTISADFLSVYVFLFSLPLTLSIFYSPYVLLQVSSQKRIYVVGGYRALRAKMNIDTLPDSKSRSGRTIFYIASIRARNYVEARHSTERGLKFAELLNPAFLS